MVRRVMLVGILLGCLAVAAVLINWARKPSMALLYSNLSPQEASRIVEKVRDADVQYELKAGGTTVYVEEEKVYSLRLTIAAEGLPTGDQAGYSILDEESFGSSPFKQRVNYIRALEGELAKSIQLIEGIVSARVHVVKPQGRVFSGKQSRATASVILQLRAGKRMTATNIAAIINLVAGAIEGLEPQNVVVVDSTGTPLSGGTDDSLAKKAGTFLDYKSQVEDYLARKAEEMLTAVLGPNRASVKVAATIETSSTSSAITTFDPVKKVISREEIKSSSSTAGTGSAEKKGKSGSTKEEIISTDYMVSKTVTEKMELPGKITQLKVAAFVDLAAATKPEGEGETAKAANLTLEDVKAIIQNALGLKDTKDIEVRDTPFHQPPAPAAVEEPGMFSLDNILKILRQLSLGILVMGALLMLKILGGKKKSQQLQAAPALAGQTAGGGKFLPAATAGLDPEALRAHITHALQENPEEVKQLFLNWAEGEKGEA